MQKIDKQQFLGRPKTRTRIGFAALALALGILAGCAAGSKVQTQETSVKEASSVTRLGDGREGFIIQENTVIDSEAAKDFERAVVMMREGDYGAASSLLEKVVERAPGVTAPYINLAIACMHNGKPERAEQHLQTVLRLIPAHPVASNEYGLLLRKGGRFKEAREIYENALASFPDYLPVHRNLGILCDLYLNDPECALNQFEIYSEWMPADAQVKIWVAELRTRLGR